MDSISTDQAIFLRQYVLGIAQNEHRTTRAVIEAIPHSKPDYRPDPFSKTALELAWHVAAAEHRFHQGIIAGAFDLSPGPRPESLRSGAEIGQWFGEVFVKSAEQIAKLPGDQLASTIDFRRLRRPAIVFLSIALNHSIHHRGQLSAYLRAMGGKVPAIYGESYDSALARQAAQTRA